MSTLGESVDQCIVVAIAVVELQNLLLECRLAHYEELVMMPGQGLHVDSVQDQATHYESTMTQYAS